MNYTSKISFSFLNLSKEQLLDIEKFILSKLGSDNCHSNVILYCGNKNIEENSIATILATEEIANNFNELKSVWGQYINSNNNDKISLHIFNQKEIKEIEINISSHLETFSIGNKQLFEDYLKKIFLASNTLTDDLITNTQDIKKMNTVACRKNEPLIEYIKASNLSLKDLREIELLILQDISIEYKYKIFLKSLSNILKKNPAAKSYTFYSIDDLLKNTDLTNEIEQYNIEFQLYSDEINICVTVEQENKNNLSKISTSGKNQTLYYGKMLLLKNFFKFKQAWYWIFYTDLSWCLELGSVVLISTLFGKVLIFIIYEHIFLWKYASLIILYIILVILFRRAFPKIKIQPSKKSHWINDTTIQFYITCLITIISTIVTQILSRIH